MVTKATTAAADLEHADAADVAAAGRSLVRKAEQEMNPAMTALKEQAMGHTMRKVFDVTGKAMGWIGGIYAIGSGVVLYRNRNRDGGQAAGR